MYVELGLIFSHIIFYIYSFDIFYSYLFRPKLVIKYEQILKAFEINQKQILFGVHRPLQAGNRTLQTSFLRGPGYYQEPSGERGKIWLF